MRTIKPEELKEIIEKHGLNRINLTDADLKGADLKGANLTGADLTDANLQRTILCDALFHDTMISFRGAKRLVNFSDAKDE